MTTFIECFLPGGKSWAGQFKDPSLYLELEQGQWRKLAMLHTLQAYFCPCVPCL